MRFLIFRGHHLLAIDSHRGPCEALAKHGYSGRGYIFDKNLQKKYSFALTFVIYYIIYY